MQTLQDLGQFVAQRRKLLGLQQGDVALRAWLYARGSRLNLSHALSAERSAALLTSIGSPAAREKS